MSILKEKVITINPKKGFCNLILCAVIFCIVAGIGITVKFGNRISEVRQKIEVINELNERIQQNNTEENVTRKNIYENQNKIKWKNLITLTTSDYVFLALLISIFWIILCIYWLYTTAYVVSKSLEVGANTWLFGVLTLLTNIVGVASLWIYIKIHLVCPNCGKLQSRKANNCSICGTAMYLKCKDCGSRISIKDKYCNGCGRKMEIV